MSISFVHEETAAAGALERTVALAESVCFARDLGGTLTHVLVAAVGRAVASGPVRCALGGDTAVVLALDPPRADPVVTVPESRSAPLPELRRVVDVLLAGGRPAGEGMPPGTPSVVVALARPGEPTAAAPAGGIVVALLTADDGGALDGRLVVTGDAAGEPAARLLLHEVAHLLERPYRRLR